VEHHEERRGKPITNDATASADAFLEQFKLADYGNTYGKTIA